MTHVACRRLELQGYPPEQVAQRVKICKYSCCLYGSAVLLILSALTCAYYGFKWRSLNKPSMQKPLTAIQALVLGTNATSLFLIPLLDWVMP